MRTGSSPPFSVLGVSTLAIGLAALFWAEPAGAEPRPPEFHKAPPARLELANGDVVQGWLDSAPEEDAVAWQAEAFTTPFVFPLHTLKSIVWPDRNAGAPTGEYRCELAGGDVLYGTLVDVRDGELLLDVPALGPLHLDLRGVRRLSPWDRPANRLFLGPGPIAEWRSSGGEWSAEGGQLTGAGPQSQLQREFALPPRGRIEFRLSWRTHWDCDVSIGTTANDPAPFRFEVWRDEPPPASPWTPRPPNWARLLGGGAVAPDPQTPPVSLDPLHLMLVRTVDMTADATRVQSLADCRVAPWQPDSLAGRLHLLVYFDFEAGRLLVHSSAGEPLAELQLPAGPPTGSVSLLFDKRSGDVRIERIEITRWDGERPASGAAGEVQLVRTDGSTVSATRIAFDPQNRVWHLSTEQEDLAIAADDLVELCGAAPEAVAAGRLRAELVNGQSLCGDLVGVERDVVRLQRAGVREPLNVPVAMLRALVPRESPPVPLSVGGADDLAQPVGQMQLPGSSLWGRLVDNRPADGPGLVWQPVASLTASRLRAETPASIDYPEPTRPSARANPSPLLAPGHGLVSGGIDGRSPVPVGERPSILHLRSGDQLAGHHVEITDEGVMCQSRNHDFTRLPFDLVSALDLQPGASIGPAAQAKFERSLTLPRSQQAHPPTHLVHARDGDCLRCRLLSLDADELRVEVHQRVRSIPRETVTRIQWLNPDGVEPPPPPGPGLPGTTRVLARLDNRLRIALAVDRVVGDLLLGTHEPLGTVRIDLARTRRLETQPTGPMGVVEPEFAGWRLRPAIAPRPRPDRSATEPALRLGQPAPDVQLELLGGEPLRLADLRGDVVVLEFWASWCEPCLRTLPQAEAVVGEFPAGTVRLIAVNLEESAEVARQTLDRLQLKTQVALDKQGAIAAQFGATELPQTVVIDRAGRVAKVLVGGGVEFRTNLRETLRAVRDGDAGGKQ